MPVFNNILAGSSGQSTGYDIDQSVRLDNAGADNPGNYLARMEDVWTTDGNQKTWTISWWMKWDNEDSNSERWIYHVRGDIATSDVMGVDAILLDNEQLHYYCYTDGFSTLRCSIKTNRVFRDPSAWYHCMIVMDSTLAAAADRTKFYVNGVRETSFATDTQIPQDQATNTNMNANTYVGASMGATSTQSFGGYLAEFHRVDGQALGPASFGETNSATNQWVPIEVTGITYGTNGFYEKFSSTELANSFTDDNFPFTISTSNYFGDSSDGSLSTSGNVTHTVQNKNGSYDGDMVIKQYSSLTISSGHTMTVDQPCRGMFIYVDGDCTIDGTLSMSGMGGASDPTASGGSDSNAVGANGIQLGLLTSTGSESFTNDGSGFNGAGTGVRTAVANQSDLSSNGTVLSISKLGATGGASHTGGGFHYTAGTTAASGTTGAATISTGGGGSGAAGSGSGSTGTSGAGGRGGAFSGGSGSGACHANNYIGGRSTSDGANYGGAGSDALSQGGAGVERGGGGAGSPSGGGADGGASGQGGAGGIIWLVVKGDLTIGASGSIVANGSAGGSGSGGNSNGGGGGSGGGAILTACAGSVTNSGTMSSAAGSGGASDYGVGGSGGAGGVLIPSNLAPGAHTITAGGDVANTRAQAKIGESSINFDGTGDYLEMPDSGDWDFGSSSWTVEGWFYVSSWTDSSFIWNHWQDDNNFLGIRVLTGGDLNILTKASSSVVHNIDFTSVDLPTSTWVHLAVVRDTSAGNFVIYKDGTSVGSTANAVAMPDVAGTARINGGRVYGNYWTGNLDEFRVSNSARYTGTFTPSTTAFTADANTLLLIHSDFNGGLGADSSGNKNDFSVTNLVATDQVLDTPTLNYSTLNPLINSSGTPAYSEGNLVITPDGSNYSVYQSTISVSSGKWYAEYLVGDTNTFAGVSSADQSASAYGSYWDNTSADFIFFNNNNGNKIIDGAATSYVGAGATVGQIVGVAIDLDGNAINFYINNSAQGSISFSGGVASASSFVFSGVGYAADAERWNFGQDSSFAGAKTAQGNGDDGEDFYYTPPAGYKALNSSNLDDPAIALPTDHFETVLYTGTGASHTISSLDFAPDFTWHKSRSYASSNALFDSVRGGNNVLSSNGTGAEVTYSDMITAFLSNGFTMGADASQAWINQSSYTYASWNWKAGGTASSNGDGSITSSVSANTTAGFSIVSYTGHGATTGTVGHGLGVKPDLIITKYLPGAASWSVYNSPRGATKVIWLDDTSAEGTGITYWRDTEPTASVFSVGASGTTGGNANPYIAYCFSSIEGYSKVGSYTGNANADGPFIYTGFNPAFLIIKRTDSAKNWFIHDNKRSTHNVIDGETLKANTSGAEVSDTGFAADFVSNGFKLRTADDGYNSGTYIYLAFAESPFKTSNAR